MKRTEGPRRLPDLTNTRHDLPQQLLQRDYLTPALYGRMSPVQRYLMAIEQSNQESQSLRQLRNDHKSWCFLQPD